MILVTAVPDLGAGASHPKAYLRDVTGFGLAHPRAPVCGENIVTKDRPEQEASRPVDLSEPAYSSGQDNENNANLLIFIDFL